MTVRSTRLRVCALAILLLAATVPARAQVVASDSDLVQKLLPAVVTIAVRMPASTGDTLKAATQDDSGKPWKQLYGSGFVIDPTGIIVTNRHVVDGARDIVVGFSDGRRAVGRILATGGEADVALLKIAADTPLPVLTLGDSDAVRVGDHVLVIGNPLGVGISVSSGIVSGLNRNIKDGPYDSFIQTDAALNHGSSGGPLIDMSGKVVGVSTALFSNVANGGSIGLGFALTSNGTRFVVDRLLKYGRIMAGWIGVGLQDVTPAFADALSLPVASGSIIDTIDPDMPAAKAGLREGDVILAIDGATPPDSRALMRDIAHREVGSTVHLRVWHAGRAQEVDVVLVEWPGDMVAAAPSPEIAYDVDRGLQLSGMTAPLRRRFGIGRDNDGVVVTGVAPEIITGERELVPGDVIERVQDQAVSTPADVWQALTRARQEHKTHVAMLVHGRDGQTWVPLLLKSVE